MSLLGRVEECAEIDSMLAAARAGGSRVLVLRGEAGVGKSTILDYATDAAAEMEILRAAGVESDMELAFAALHQFCAPLVGRLDQLPDPQRNALEIIFGRQAGPPPDRLLVGLAVLSLLSDASEDRPLLCVVDDAQWLDVSSAQVLGFVARRLLAESTALVFGTRWSHPELANLPELEVTGLADRDARALLDSVTHSQLDDRVRDRIVAETRGNPLALLELPRGLTVTQMAGGFGLVHSEPLSGRIEQGFMARIEELPEPARQLVLVAAAEPVGDPVLVWRAVERLGVTPQEAVVGGTDGLLSIDERVRFRHPLVRSAIYGAAAPEMRRAAHQALADVTDMNIDPDRRAWHLAAASVGPDERVAAELERSAERAQARGGLAAMAAFLQRSVALTADTQNLPGRVLAAAAASLQAGEADRVETLLARLSGTMVSDLHEGQAMALRGQVAFASGRAREATELLLASGQLLATADHQLARDVYMSAWGAATSVGDPEILEAVSSAARALPLPSNPGPIDLLLDGLTLMITDGRVVAAPALQEAAKVLMDISADDVLKWGWVAAGAAGAIWDDGAMLAMYTRHARVVREAGALTDLPYHLASLCLITSWTGDFPAATGLIAEADTVSEAIGSPMPPYAELRLLSLQGREAETLEIIGPTIASSTAAGFGLGVVAANWAAAVLYNGLARYPEALRAIQSNGALFDANLSAWILPELVEAAVRVGDTEVALDALDRLVRETQPFETAFAQGIEARSRALLAEGEAAEKLYTEAIEKLGRTSLRPELARAHLLYGEWLRRGQQRAEARTHLRAAHEMFTSIGMTAFAERARRELLATGERMRKRSDPSSSRDELTPQERQIALLVRAGLSNPEVGARLFLSPRTVEWHLRKVFEKLSISSRKELREALPDGADEASR